MSNLPERQDVGLATLGGQVALFEDSGQLLALTDAELRHLAAVVGEDAESGLAQMRRRFGLLAWAGWLRFEGKPYEEFVSALARYVGVNPRTVKSWRDSVVEKDTLAVPPATGQRRQEAAVREEKGRSARVRAEKQHGKPIIPATSTEAPDKQSAGDGEGQVLENGPRPPLATSPEGLALASETVPDPAHDVPGSPDPNPPELTDPVDVDAIGLRWLQSKNDRQVRALADPLGGAIRAEVRRWALAFGYVKGGELRTPATWNGTVDRPIVTLPSIPGPKLVKRHADDCRCLSCVPPKAAAK